MKHLKKSFSVIILLSVMTASYTFAQDFLDLSAALKLSKEREVRDREKEVIQDNEYTNTGFEEGNFYNNPLLLDGKPLDYYRFNPNTKGELTVIKGAVKTAKTVQVPFYIYLRRDGNKISIPGLNADATQNRIEISNILKHSQPGDDLVIEAVNKQDGPVKRILKIFKGGC